MKDLPSLGGSLQDWKPGLYYGVDDQCRIAFGSTARACSFTNPDLVSHLLHQPNIIITTNPVMSALLVTLSFSQRVVSCPVTFTLMTTAPANVSWSLCWTGQSVHLIRSPSSLSHFGVIILLITEHYLQYCLFLSSSGV